MGSVSEDGRLFLNESVINQLGVRKDDIEREKELQLKEIKQRSDMIRRSSPRIPLKNRLAIVTDDGVATGATFQAALWAVKTEEPSSIIAAIPVCSRESAKRMADDADELVCLRVPPFFAAVGQFYSRFDTVGEEVVLAMLREARKKEYVR
jgi:predicted phosphoribosyltransferase